MTTNPNGANNTGPAATESSAVTTGTKVINEDSLGLNPISIPLPPSDGGGSRSAPAIKIIVLHSSEMPGGADFLQNLATTLNEQRLSVQIGVNTDGTCARYFSDLEIAYDVTNYNDQAVGIEQAGYAAKNSWPSALTKTTAKWIAYWASKYNIPITHSTTHGVCTHKDLGAAGGGHVDPGPYYPFTQVLEEASEHLGKVYITNGEPEVGGAGESGISAAEAQSISKGAALAAFINLPGLLEKEESLSLKGERSLMNDQPLLPFVEQLCKGGLRNFMSMPNGAFFAFIPDYFGGLTGRTPYWEIDDIEILDGEIVLSDDALATHVYIVGDTGVINGQIELAEKMQTFGVVTVFNAFMADFLNGVNSPALTDKGKTNDTTTKQYIEDEEKVPSLANKAKATAFLERYGARPFYEEAPMIRSHYFEAFLAYQMFCLLWSKQFLTTFEFTFMPELIPGGLVAFPQHGLQCYIDEVQHTGDYSSGFRTRANLSAPAALPGGNTDLNAGMIRAGIFNPEEVGAVNKERTSRGNKGQTGSKHALKK